MPKKPLKGPILRVKPLTKRAPSSKLSQSNQEHLAPQPQEPPMPATTADTPTLTRTFADHKITVPAPFTEGHALTANEAKWVNSQLATVVGNAFGGAVRKGLLGTADPQTFFMEKYNAYTLGESNRGDGKSTSSADPLDRTINFLNSEDIKARAIAKGFKVRDLMKAKVTVDGVETTKWAQLLAQNLAVKGDIFRAQAQAQLDALAASDAPEDDLFEALPEAA